MLGPITTFGVSYEVYKLTNCDQLQLPSILLHLQAFIQHDEKTYPNITLLNIVAKLHCQSPNDNTWGAERSFSTLRGVPPHHNRRRAFERSILATSPLALRWMCDSPWTGCVRRTTPIYMWHEQAILEWLRRMISIVSCCHSVKLCALAARGFRSQH